MDLVFMGTPDFAVPTLETLIQSKHNVKAVVTRPDKPKGRSGRLVFPPVKEVATAYGIPVLQPVKVKEEAFIRTLRAYQPDGVVVVAFGQILPEDVLSIPTHGCLNVHASLLPKLRGAAPIQWAVIHGEKETGVTIMKMDSGLDTGNILLSSKVPLSEEETGGSLHDKLSVLGGPLMLEALDAIESGTIKEKPQTEEEASYASMLTKEMGNLDFTKSAIQIERLIRGLNPWPSAYMQWNGRIIKIWRAKALSMEKLGEAGDVVRVSDQELYVQTGDGVLSLEEVQMEGRKRMRIDEFLRGFKNI